MVPCIGVRNCIGICIGVHIHIIRGNVPTHLTVSSITLRSSAIHNPILTGIDVTLSLTGIVARILGIKTIHVDNRVGEVVALARTLTLTNPSPNPNPNPNPNMPQ